MTAPWTIQNFQSSNEIPLGHIWGGGHTPESDPSNRGWRVKRLFKNSTRDVFMFGQRGQAGCATAVLLGDHWDVGFYPDEPAVIAKQLQAGGIDAFFASIPDRPGFGLRIIAAIERERRGEPLQRDDDFFLVDRKA